MSFMRFMCFFLGVRQLVSVSRAWSVRIIRVPSLTKSGPVGYPVLRDQGLNRSPIVLWLDVYRITSSRAIH